MKIFFQIFISVAAIFGICVAARAAEITVFSFDNSTKTIQASGVCDGHSVVIHIFVASSTEPFYMAGSECAGGKFNFQDNLGYWKILPGEYRAIVYDANSPLTNPSEEKIFTVAAVASEEYLSSELPNNSTSTEEADKAVPENFFTQLLDAFSNWLANAVLKIKELIALKITVSDFCVGATCINEDDLKGFLKDKKNPHLDIEEPQKEEDKKGGSEENNANDAITIENQNIIQEEQAVSSTIIMDVIESSESPTSTETEN